MSDNPTLRVAFSTLGCKVNQSETDLLARQFSAAGYCCVPFDEPADVYVVNSCTVTHVADKKSRQVLGQARRSNPEALVVATGCYASIVGDALTDERTLVVRNRDKDRLLTMVEARLQRAPAGLPPPMQLGAIDPEKYLDLPGQAGSWWRSRSQVKAQDGCDSHCTYCIIPRARGRSRSVPPDEVVRRVNALVGEGHAEVVITGVDLGSYGEDGVSLPDLGGLLKQVLEQTEVKRVRVSSLEPGDFDESWLDLWDTPRLCRHLHVPLQAGSATVLQRMERRYTPQQFARMVAACRRAVPDITITTDVMAGFPGETEEEFDEGYHFIRELQFDGMHVFKYSRRSGTRAARMADQVAEDIKNERSRVLREEALAGVERLVSRHVDRPAAVVWEVPVGTAPGGYPIGPSGVGETSVWRGLTDTNVRVYREGDHRVGSLSHVRLTEPFRDGLWSEPMQVETLSD